MKSVIAAISVMIMALLAGCGSGSTGSVNTNVAGPATFGATELSGKTTYSVSTSGITAYQLNADGSATWVDTAANTPPTPPFGTTGGTWEVTGGQLLIKQNGTTIHTFTRLVEAKPSGTPTYWLVGDESGKITRFFLSPNDAAAYFSTLNPTRKLGGSVQGSNFVFSNTTTAIMAGTSGQSGFANFSGATAPTRRFNSPVGVTTDGTNLYVADYNNNCIRQINLSNNAVTTIAGSTSGLFGTAVQGPVAGTDALFHHPSDITTDGTSLYVTDSENNAIRKIDISTHQVTTIAGSSSALSGSDDKAGPDARFNLPNGITTDGTNLYVSDSGNHTIRRITLFEGANGTPGGTATSQYMVTTLAGSARNSGSTDGTGQDARFNQPARLTTDGSNLYVADFGNRTIRRISLATGNVVTLAGVAGQIGTNDTAPQVTANFTRPNGITTDGTYLYVSDGFPANLIRRVTIADGSVTTLSLGNTFVSINDGNPANIHAIAGITTNGSRLFVVDTGNDTIWKIK